MRKFLFFILLLPAIASLGHDIYFFSLNQEKGFRLTDLGALWDKYEKNSHDQWKNTVKTLENDVSDLTRTDTRETTNLEPPAPKPDYMQEFTQENIEENAHIITVPESEKISQEEPTELQSIIGLILEQKAVFVFGGIALIAFLINSLSVIISQGMKPRVAQVSSSKKSNRKGGGYKYKRK